MNSRANGKIHVVHSGSNSHRECMVFATEAMSMRLYIESTSLGPNEDMRDGFCKLANLLISWPLR